MLASPVCPECVAAIAWTEEAMRGLAPLWAALRRAVPSEDLGKRARQGKHGGALSLPRPIDIDWVRIRWLVLLLPRFLRFHPLPASRGSAGSGWKGATLAREAGLSGSGRTGGAF